MQPRMKNPVVPEAMQALLALAKSAEQGGVPPQTLSLVHLRASQINGCSVCVDLALRVKKAEDTNERLFAVALGGTRHISATPNAPRWRWLRLSHG